MTKDPLAWLEDLDNPHTQNVIAEETKNYQDFYQSRQEEVEQLFTEIKSRIQLDDSSVPWTLGNYRYYWRNETELEYSLFCRQPLQSEEEQICLDENQLSRGLDFFSLGAYSISPCHRYLAFCIDTVGNERHILMIKDLTNGVCLIDRISNVSCSLAWSADSQFVFYVQLDKESRPYRCFRHRLGSLPTEDKLIHTEWDSRYFVDVSLSKSEAYLLLSCESKTTSECHILAANQATNDFTCLAKRQQDVRYYLEHHGNDFFILSDEAGINFSLLRVAANNPDKKNWHTLLAVQDEITLEEIAVFKDFIVILERKMAQRRFHILGLGDNQTDKYLDFDDATYSIAFGDNVDINSNCLRFEYESLSCPNSVYDYELLTQNKTLLKQDKVLGEFNPASYCSEKLLAETKEGVQIPISLVYHKEFTPNSNSPLLLYGYGAYGHALDPWFSIARLSLLNRGFIFAIAHIRGGGDCGEAWYQAGKLEHKENSFSDFATCAQYLISNNYTSSQKLAISGGSAGGLLIGAVLNRYPNLCHLAIAHVPFVDVLNTMMNTNLPLTVTEYEEWGDPNDPAVYQRIQSYSPYDNIVEQSYPKLYVSCGIHDCRVSYWEALKWIKTIRQRAKNSPEVLVKINQEAGHGGASGRFAAMREIAEEYLYLLHSL